MGPTNGKNIIHVSNCRQKRSVYTLPFTAVRTVLKGKIYKMGDIK